MFHDFLSLRRTRSLHFAILGNWNGSQAHEKRKDRAKITRSEGESRVRVSMIQSCAGAYNL